MTQILVCSSCGNKLSAEQRLIAAIFGQEPECGDCFEIKEEERTEITVNGQPLTEYMNMKER